jgi:uncharacterized protein (DUF1684 family)
MTDTSTVQAPATPEERAERFRSRRAETVVAPRGFLALVNTQWVDSEQPIWGVPGLWAPRPDGEPGLQVTATAADGITVDGNLVDGTVLLSPKNSETPSEIAFDDHTSGTIITGHDGASNALRVWDSQSEAIQNFGRIDAFPYDPAWVVSGVFTPNPEGTTAGFAHIKDEGEAREMVIPGSIRFEHDGVDYEILAFKEGRALQLVFADATSGDSTYSVGRFLFTAPNRDGSITLDFNNALLPPCAFSYNFNCPMPPKQNRFPFPVEAGEKNVLAKDGSLLNH